MNQHQRSSHETIHRMAADAATSGATRAAAGMPRDVPVHLSPEERHAWCWGYDSTKMRAPVVDGLRPFRSA